MLPWVRSRLNTGAWLATIAMLALALLPAVSRALASGTASPGLWSEVCTTQGRADAADPAGQDAQPAAAATVDRCALCVLAAGAPPLAAGAVVLAAPAGTAAAPRPLERRSPYGPPAWTSAQPRAPPLAS